MLKATATINNNKNCVLFRHYAVLFLMFLMLKIMPAKLDRPNGVLLV